MADINGDGAGSHTCSSCLRLKREDEHLDAGQRVDSDGKFRKNNKCVKLIEANCFSE